MFCILLKLSNISVPFLCLIGTQPTMIKPNTYISWFIIIVTNADEAILAKQKQLSTVGIHFQLLTSHFCCTPSGPEGQHEAPLPVGEWSDLPSLWVWTQVQEAAVCTVLLSQSAVGEKKVPHAGMECHLWLQWLWLWSEWKGLLDMEAVMEGVCVQCVLLISPHFECHNVCVLASNSVCVCVREC